MASATQMFEVGSEVIGYVGLVATWRRPATEEERKRRDPMLIIHSSADTDEGVHTPAQSITINNRAGLVALRKAIDDALAEPVDSVDAIQAAQGAKP